MTEREGRPGEGYAGAAQQSVTKDLVQHTPPGYILITPVGTRRGDHA